MKKKVLLLSLIIMSLLIGCQGAARSFGGSITVHLDPNEKLELVTWKDDALWYLTRPMREDEIAETHIYKESSEWHVMEGEVKFIEYKK